MKTYFIDSNIWAWYLNKNSVYHTNVKDYLNDLIKDVNNSFLINEIVAIEVFHYLIKRCGPKEGKTLAKRLINYSFISIDFILQDKESLLEVLDILIHYGITTTIGGRDSSIISSMKKNKVHNIITHDKGYSHVTDINVHDPLF